MTKIVVYKGGAGSGDFGHAGRPGKVGGSSGSPTVDATIHEVSKFFGVEPIIVHTTNAKFQADYPLQDPSAKVVGAYNQVTGELIVVDDCQAKKKPGAKFGMEIISSAAFGEEAFVIHELAHQYDYEYYAKGSVGTLTRSLEWEKIYKAYYKKATKDSSDVISRYSLVNTMECFAEAMVAYRLQPDWLRSKNPKMYAYIEKSMRQRGK